MVGIYRYVKKVEDRMRHSALHVTTRDDATYPSTFFDISVFDKSCLVMKPTKSLVHDRAIAGMWTVEGGE